MDKLKTLIDNIRREGKMDTDKIICCLVDAFESCDKDCAKNVFVNLYRKSYGDNITKDLAQEWVHSFRVTDNSSRDNGEKWSIEQTTDVGNQIGIDWNKITKYDWYVVLNMEYSKHYNTAKSYGNETDPMWFAHIARDEWCNKDKSVFDYYIEFAL